MSTPNDFEKLLANLTSEHLVFTFDYGDPLRTFKSVVKTVKPDFPAKMYGIYIVREQASNTIVYIGKAGTVSEDGQFQGQDILGRLTNVKNKDPLTKKDISANKWFSDLYTARQGSLRVECLAFTSPVSPREVERELLQTYEIVYGTLPFKNKQH